MADIVVEIADLELEKKTLEECLLKARRDIITAARQLSNNENAVIVERYVHLMSWKDISEKLGYSGRQIRRLRQTAEAQIQVPTKAKMKN